jgi:hypothetical protein
MRLRYRQFPLRCCLRILQLQGWIARAPLCPYPQTAAYKGTGSTDDRANFVCRRSLPGVLTVELAFGDDSYVLKLNYDPTNNPLNNNEWAFPLFECIHIAMFTMSVGTIALVDFRLLGLTLRRYSAVQLVKATSLWTLVGLVAVITSGIVIATTDPLRYYYNWSFRYKMIALVCAIIYNYTIHRKVAMSEASPLASAAVGGFSLLLWTSIAFAGIFYAFT